MRLPVTVATAVTGHWESLLVTGLGREPRVRVVRRCADLPELLATVGSGQATAALLSAGLPDLDAEAVARLASARCAVVALVEPGDEDAAQRMTRLGLSAVLPADSPAASVAQAVLTAEQDVGQEPSPSLDPSAAPGGGPGAGTGSAVPLALGDPRAALSTPGPLDPLGPKPLPPQQAGPQQIGPQQPGSQQTGPRPPRPRSRPRGAVVAVWGPVGAPGRTTVALSLASEVAATGEHALLVDADTYGACVAQLLGVLDEAPGLAGAARAADRGLLDVDELARHAAVVDDRLRVLTGLGRAHRWPELRGTSVAQVLEVARELTAWTVVDTGFCLEQDEELAYDTAAPRRNAATLVALAAADVVVAVGSADPVGLQRLVRGLQDLADTSQAPVVVVVNRVRSGSVGAPARRQVRDALSRFAGVSDPVLVPHDQPALDAATLAGRTLVETRGSRPVRQAVQELVHRVQVALPPPLRPPLGPQVVAAPAKPGRTGRGSASRWAALSRLGR